MVTNWTAVHYLTRYSPLIFSWKWSNPWWCLQNCCFSNL